MTLGWLIVLFIVNWSIAGILTQITPSRYSYSRAWMTRFVLVFIAEIIIYIFREPLFIAIRWLFKFKIF